MSTHVVSPSPSFLNEISFDPALTFGVAEHQWQPPLPWDELALDRDRRQWVESLVDLDLLPKATSAVTCRNFFRKILEFSTHWVRVGRTTCHLFTCRNCGTGKMRAHRLWAADQRRFQYICDQFTRTIRLTVHYSSPAGSPAAYLARIAHDRRYVTALWRKMQSEFHDSGFIRSVELDPRRRNVVFRLYYAGEDCHHAWLSSTWQRIVGMQAQAESKGWWENSADALRWTLDLSQFLVDVPGPERAQWEKSFEGFRLTASTGILRGAKLDAAMEKLPEGDKAAPYGHCPCGCGGVVVKSQHHDPQTLAQLSTAYSVVDFGPLRTYIAHRDKADGNSGVDHQESPKSSTATASPPS